MKVAYFPGCSLHSTAREYDQSVRAVAPALGVQLITVEDWNCCGATSAHSLDPVLSLALPARNLARAQAAGHQVVVAPCAACFNRLKTALCQLEEGGEAAQTIQKVVGFRFHGGLQVKSLVQLFWEDVGVGAIRRRVCRPLEGLRVACYYGCLLVRPPEVAAFDDPEHPRAMDDLMAAIGAEPTSWAAATECCGASLSLVRGQVVERLVSTILAWAQRAGAEAVVTACPLCQSNLEMRRPAHIKMPIFYFTELMGLALGLPDVKRWMRAHLVDPAPVLSRFYPGVGARRGG